jgi:hypothetical protein
MMKKALLLAAASLIFAAPVVPALAHEDGYYENEFDHYRDHQEHARFHEEFDDAHAQAHAYGFGSRAEHRAWHRTYGEVHDEFHQDHPNTRHDGWGYEDRAQPTYSFGFWGN